MFFPQTPLSLSDFLQLNTIDTIFLDQFNALNEHQKITKLLSLLNNNKIDLIVKLACNIESFRKLCMQSDFSTYWVSLWSTFGVVITGNPTKALYDQPDENKFDLFLGIFFYHKALECAKNVQYDYSAIELAYLEKAMEFGSVHAYQRYHKHLYLLVGTTDSAEAQGLLETIIKNTKSLVPRYGAYAYLMMTDAYIHFALHMKNAGDITRANKAKNAALKACMYAQKTYKKSQAAIFNASLGGTIADSNQQELSNFDEIEILINELFTIDEAGKFSTHASKGE